MAEEKVEVRDINYRHTFPWVELFRGFQVALDPKKLLLAAAGIVVMAVGWAVISWAFFSLSTEPLRSDYSSAEYKKSNPDLTDAEAERRADADYRREKAKWDVLAYTAGPGGIMRTWPWFEDRGPNPYLVVTGQSGPSTAGSTLDSLKKQGLVLIEPLVKYLTPIVYLLHPDAGFMDHLYCVLVLVWTIATWALFGGAITRMAAVQLTRREKISLAEALRFTGQRYLSYFSAPLFPMVFVVGILVLLVIYGFLHLIPVVGDIVVDGIGWPLVLLAGLVMAIILVGLTGWPLMYATISTEGSDSFDALSRSYSYVYQCPWHYLWNSAVAVVYGAILVFFVGLMGSLTVYLGKWAVGQTPGVVKADREPSYLFVYAPTSYHWRDLLLQGSPALNADGTVNEEYIQGKLNSDDKREGGFSWYNKVGAFLVSCWLYLAFLAVVGFGYSYFWCASTIIYLLMRHKVDDTDLDEIYLEEDDLEDAYTPPTMASTSGTPAPTGGATSLTMVEPPALKPNAPVPPAPSPVSAPAEGVTTPADGNPGSA